VAEANTIEADLLQEQSVARLVALLDDATVRALIDALQRDVEATQAHEWEWFHGRTDDFGPSLARQMREGRRLSANQLACAKARLLPRNWYQIKRLLQRGGFVLPKELLSRAHADLSIKMPVYESRLERQRREERHRRDATQQTTEHMAAAARLYADRRAQGAPPLSLQPVADTCGRQVRRKNGLCILRRGHTGTCLASGRTRPRPVSIDEQIRQTVAEATEQAVAPPPVPAAPVIERTGDPSVDRFRLLDLDDDRAPELEDESDPSVDRFLRLDLD